MDVKGNIENHSKAKLNIYKKYLETYLLIMYKLDYCSDIFIVEPFAGKGISDNGEEGSAVIAKKAIKSISTPKNKNVHLILNDINEESYKDLVKNLEHDGNRISCSNKDANGCIVYALSKANNKTYYLFFIDPWGYTQVKQETYKKIFKAKRLDFLIFIPVNHIYRFLRKDDNSQQLKPIANFLNDMGINEKDAKKYQDVLSFVNGIKKAFTKKLIQNMFTIKYLKTQIIVMLILLDKTYSRRRKIFRSFR